MSSQASGAPLARRPPGRRAAPSTRERASFRQGRLPPQIWAPTEHRPPSLNWRCRADCAQGAAGSFANGGMISVSSQASGAPLARKPPGRRAAPSAMSMRVGNRFLPFEGEFQTRAAPAAKVGPRRPPARSLRLGERGVLTIYFRWALPRRLRVRRPPSFQMVGMARRRRPKIQARSAVRGVSMGWVAGLRIRM